MRTLTKLRFEIKIILTICLATFFISCAYRPKLQLQEHNKEAKYRNSFPTADIGAELETVILSVKKITNYLSYRTYIFDEDSRVTLKDLHSESLLQHTRAGIVTSDATAGTALVLFSDGKHIALLTCAHAVKAPDTIIDWNEYRDLSGSRYIRRISIKLNQQLFVRGMPEGSKFQVLASDAKKDIAFIGVSYNDPVNDVPVFNGHCGNSAELRFGAFLYLAGYPAGQLMITHGIVSLLPEKSGNFLTDALFNEGMSGGIALAVTQKGENLELVGMARSVAATYCNVLKPEKENHEFLYNPVVPYTGNIYAEQKKDISYGITSVISSNQIQEFYKENRTALTTQGFNLDDFFGMKTSQE